MARLGNLFLKNFNFLTTGNLCVNRVRPEFCCFISSKTDIYEKIRALNIPAKPKRPGSTYIIFVRDINEKLRKEHPDLSMKQIVVKCGEMWKNIGSMQKEEYHQKYLNLQKQYEKDLLKYQESLTPEQRLALEELHKEEDRVKKQRKLKKELIELNKPKRPLTSFGQYYKALVDTGNGPVKVSKDIGETWRNLPESEKQIYIDKAKEAKEQYDKEIREWEELMIIRGRQDLVRKEVLDKVTAKKSRILKYGAAKKQHTKSPEEQKEPPGEHKETKA